MADESAHVVPDLPSGPLRIAHYAHSVFESISTATRARKLVKRGFVLLNGSAVETSRLVSPGDVLTPTPSPPAPLRDKSIIIAKEFIHNPGI